MYKGKVKMFDVEKGFGFITLDSALESEDIFVHFSSLNAIGQRTLLVGQELYFEIADGVRGPQAVNLELI